MEKKTGVYVLEKGIEALISRAWFTDYAEKSIDIQYFIFSTDNIGLIACDYLVRAADRGVKVRILIDDIMLDADPSDLIQLNSHENISIKIYNSGVNLGKNIFQKLTKFTTQFKSANQRMHNKTFVVDNKIAITGGRNIADEYFDYDHEYNFRDREVLLLGKETNKVNQSFNTFWDDSLSVNVSELMPKTTVKPNFQALHNYACDTTNFWPEMRYKINEFPVFLRHLQSSGKILWLDDIQFISDIPGKNKEKTSLTGGGICTDSLINLIQQAKTSIDIQTPYLVTTKLSRDLFKAAHNRGVKIRILTNSLLSTDNLDAFNGYQRDRTKLLETGIQIFEFKPDAAIRKKIMSNSLKKKLKLSPIFGLHAKSMVIDGETTVIGTFNLDPRSANLNTECITIIRSDTIATGVLNGMNEEFKPENSWETTLQFNPDSKADVEKQVKTWTRKVVPKSIL